MEKMKLDFEKLKAVVHHICDKAEDPSCLGSIKLNKVLWYSDAIAYMSRGASITGETYVKRQFGPVPKHVFKVREELQAEGKIRRGRANYFNHIKDEFISIEDPDRSTLTADELSIIDLAFEHVCLKHTAKSVSDETHNDIWELAQIGEEIPLYTIFASRQDELDEDDIKWAKAKLAEMQAA